MNQVKTIAIDFTRLTFAEAQPFDDDFYGGIFQNIQTLMSEFAVYLRTNQDAGVVARWIMRRTEIPTVWYPPDGIVPAFWETKHTLLVTARELPCATNVDYRALQFKDWDRIYGFVRQIKEGSRYPLR